VGIGFSGFPAGGLSDWQIRRFRRAGARSIVSRRERHHAPASVRRTARTGLPPQRALRQRFEIAQSLGSFPTAQWPASDAAPSRPAPGEPCRVEGDRSAAGQGALDRAAAAAPTPSSMAASARANPLRQQGKPVRIRPSQQRGIGCAGCPVRRDRG